MWNEKLKNLDADDKSQLINVKIEAGNYESDELVNLINNVIESETQLQITSLPYQMENHFSVNYTELETCKEEQPFNFLKR